MKNTATVQTHPLIQAQRTLVPQTASLNIVHSRNTGKIFKRATTAKKLETLATLVVSGLSALVIGVSLLTLSSGSFANVDIGGAADVSASERSSFFNERKLPFKNGQRHRKEKALAGWAFSTDNDILVPSSRDQDYTYGSSFTIAGSSTRNIPLSLHQPLGWLNHQLGLAENKQTPINHSIEAGLYGFTPEDTSALNALPNDRPYASIVYWSATQTLTTASPNAIWRSTLTFGVLGLDLVGDIQNEVHRATNSQLANGWEHQISDGGELTARYSIARQTRWDLNNPNIELKTTTQASLGYLTEVSWGASLRMGKIGSRWQSYNPELTSYGEISNQSVDSKSTIERYFSLGAAIKARSYNAFLQGQFRDNPVEYSRSDLKAGIVEVWAGYTTAFSNGYQLSYLLRAHSSEIKRGDGNRHVVWGGLTLSRAY